MFIPATYLTPSELPRKIQSLVLDSVFKVDQKRSPQTLALFSVVLQQSLDSAPTTFIYTFSLGIYKIQPIPFLHTYPVHATHNLIHLLFGLLIAAKSNNCPLVPDIAVPP